MSDALHVATTGTWAQEELANLNNPKKLTCLSASFCLFAVEAWYVSCTSVKYQKCSLHNRNHRSRSRVATHLGMFEGFYNLWKLHLMNVPSQFSPRRSFVSRSCAGNASAPIQIQWLSCVKMLITRKVQTKKIEANKYMTENRWQIIFWSTIASSVVYTSGELVKKIAGCTKI